MNLTGLVSSKFKFWSFISMVLLVFVHGYNLNIRYLQPWTLPGEALTLTSFIEYFLANGIFRFRIPMLFIISGFLYALHDIKPNKQRIGKRARTLLLPYILWSTLGLLLVYLLEITVAGSEMVQNTNLVRISETTSFLHQYHWYELIFRWIFAPLPYQLWFIRVLFIYNLAYPVILWCVTNRIAKKIFFPFAFLLWLATMGFGLIEGEGLLFFSLGVYMQKTNFNIETPVRWLNPLYWGFVFIIIAAFKTWLAFYGQTLIGNAVFPVVIILHKLTVISGLIACWYGSDKLVQWFMNKPWFVWLSAFSFIIYAMHAPIVAIVIDKFMYFINPGFGTHLFAFVLLPLCLITMCILIGASLRALVPKFYSLLTGGRGMQQ